MYIVPATKEYIFHPSPKNKTWQTKNKRTREVQLHVRVYMYDFRRGVVTDN
jgi:uncharacterized protein YcfL